jgi:NADH-quinone oxidoreductase subunit C
MADLEAARRAIEEKLGQAGIAASESGGDLCIEAPAEAVSEVCTFLRDAPELLCDYPADLCARDDGEHILLWYRTYSTTHRLNVRLTVRLDRAAPEAPSVTGIWPGMNWHERECFDLYGVRFVGHPDMDDPKRMRILLPEDWEGHPFRKDYEPVFLGDPLHGPQPTN